MRRDVRITGAAYGLAFAGCGLLLGLGQVALMHSLSLIASFPVSVVCGVAASLLAACGGGALAATPIVSGSVNRAALLGVGVALVSLALGACVGALPEFLLNRDDPFGPAAAAFDYLGKPLLWVLSFGVFPAIGLGVGFGFTLHAVLRRRHPSPEIASTRSSEGGQSVSEKRKSRFLALGVTIATTVVLAAGAASFAIAGLDYSWGLFVAIPFFTGLFSVTMYRFAGPRSLLKCLLVATTVGVILLLGFLLLGQEGIICILLALPLEYPFIILGAVMGYLLFHRAALVSPVTGAVLLVFGLAATMWVDRVTRRIAPVYVVTNAVQVAASPAVVWQSLVSLGTLPPADDWIFRTGLACPLRTEIRGSGVGATRVCTLSTGELLERITAWQPDHRLAWTVLSTPPPLKEINPFQHTDPPHLHGFYRFLTGEFELRPMADGHTLVVRSSSYQHNLYPAMYWRIWCDQAVSRGHLYVLEVLKSSGEAASASTRSHLEPQRAVPGDRR